ncbi:MAG: type VI secretion system lipoprotein TssJ [Myxococcales bacterium]|nr:type VI secretion system lipoprotein TssJ [Myxococcales bacterium]
MRRALLFLPLTLALAAAPLAWVGCKQEILPVKEPKKCDLQVVTLTVVAAPLINPSNEGEARPVILRIYQLKNDVQLLNAKFEEVWKDDKKTLGEETIVKVDELPIYPNSKTEVKFERDESAQYVVGVALFRNPKGRSWFTTFELPPSPKKGQGCGATCTGEECDGGAPPVLFPKFSLWIEGTRIDTGDDHLDDVSPDAGRYNVIHLTGGAGAASGKPAGPAAPKGS